jgi:hypothetical protein
MTVAELLALPVGTRLRWDVMRMNGRVVARDGDVLRVVWTGGREAEISPEDGRHELAELADTLEVIDVSAPPSVRTKGRDTKSDTR